MFYEITLKEHRETLAGIFVANGYAVKPAKIKREKGKGFRYGIIVTECEEAEEEE